MQTPFLTVGYWIEQLPTPFVDWSLKIVLIKFTAFIVIGAALHFIARKKKANLYWRDGVSHLAVALFQTGIVGLILTWFTQQQIQFFGMRVWFLVLAVWFLVRTVLIVRKMVKIIPAKAAAVSEKARIAKYLP